MSTMRAYTREFRESAVGLVLTEGLSIRKAADDLGVGSAPKPWAPSSTMTQSPSRGHAGTNEFQGTGSKCDLTPLLSTRFTQQSSDLVFTPI